MSVYYGDRAAKAPLPWSYRKAKVYVWRVRAGVAWHADIPVWNVLDANGEIVAGGAHRGSNQRSGVAHFPTRRDAMLWVEDFNKRRTT